MVEVSTKEQILQHAQELCMLRGFNAFSFHDLARALGIKTASIHYYFPTKSDLGVELIRNYREAFAAELGKISESKSDEREQLKKFIAKLDATLDRGRLCLCGMLASDFETLSPQMKEELNKFFSAAEQWVTQLLEQGKKKGSFSFKGKADEVAQGVVASLQGFMLCARARGDRRQFSASSGWLQSVLY